MLAEQCVEAIDQCMDVFHRRILSETPAKPRSDLDQDNLDLNRVTLSPDSTEIPLGLSKWRRRR
eukprot:4659485-Amphidinium_carterae.1